MGHRLLEFQAVLAEVRRRWTRLAALRRWTLGASAAIIAILAGLGAIALVARDGLSLLVAVLVALAAAATGIACALWPLRIRPTDVRLARFIEERTGGLDDVLPTAVDYLSRPNQSGPIAEALASDALRAIKDVDLDIVVDRSDVRRALVGAAVASAALIAAIVAFSPSVERASSVASAYLFPARVTIEVTPGSTKVAAGKPLTISARVAGSDGAIVPTVTVGQGDKAQSIRMEPVGEDRYAATVPEVTASFPYLVSAASTRSPEYTVTVIRPPRVERIDLHLDFPQGLGLKARTEEDSGDIYAPAGTKVRVTVTADKPIARGQLTLADGTSVPLNGNEQVLDAGLTIDEDGSYRVALADTDGLESPGDTEYFIRTLLDRPPDVRIMRPGGDKQVTALEEVAIEARADDDFGIQSFDLVFQKPGADEKVVPLRSERGQLTVTSGHTLFLEDLGVQPGDFVTYYARARDVGRGRTASESRSDIFFLEVKPFEEEFVAAQSQAMQGGMSGGAMQELAEAQKEIIVATWKLDARGRRARDARSAEDIKAISKAQSDLKARVDQASTAMNRTMADPRRRRPGSGGPQGSAPVAPGLDNPMAKAAEAMGSAVGELDKKSTSGAIPHEKEALNQLLKADAEVKRRQIARQQGGGGGGVQNRQGPDLSTLFDQELRKRQSTNYETPNSAETREDQASQQDDPLERIKELARRQDALNRQQKDLAQNRDQLNEEEVKRRLEQLTREQNELRQQAEQLARQMQSGRQNGQQQQAQSGQQQSQSGRGQQQAGGGELREISQEMRDAATDLRRQDPKQASERGDRALERLRDLERQMQTANPDDRRRALGDLQLETRQLADSQRRLANEASRTADGDSGRDARRRLASEQERLADRTERLRESARQLARAAQGDAKEREAINEAARELERQKLAERMRQSAGELRRQGAQGTEGREGEAGGEQQQAGQSPQGQAQGQQTEAEQQAARGSNQSRDGEEMARSLDQIAERLGAAAGAGTAESRRDSDQLSKAQELRERIAQLERSVDQMRREGGDQQGQQQGQQGQSGQQGQQQGQQASQGQQGSQNQGQQGQQGKAGGQQGGGQSAQGGSQQGQSGGGGRQASGQGGGGGGQGGRLEQMQRELNEQMREAQRLNEQLRRDNPGMQGPNTPEGWWPSTSAPGTESWKQDFARWESLKKNILDGVEKLESDVSSRLRERENRERLNAGGHEAVSETYREQVEQYFRALATPRKPPR